MQPDASDPELLTQSDEAIAGHVGSPRYRAVKSVREDERVVGNTDVGNSGPLFLMPAVNGEDFDGAGIEDDPAALVCLRVFLDHPVARQRDRSGQTEGDRPVGGYEEVAPS